MPAYKYWRKIGLEHEIADISLQLEGQGESLKQNKKLKGQSLKYIAGHIYFQWLKDLKRKQSNWRFGFDIYTVRKMDPILRWIQRRLQMQLSMARKFTLQPYRR